MQYNPKTLEDGTWLVKGKGKKVYVEDASDRPSSLGLSLEHVQQTELAPGEDNGNQLESIEGFEPPSREDSTVVTVPWNPA